MLRRMLIVVASVLLLPSLLHAQRDSTRRALNGEWMGRLALDNSSPMISLAFQLTDSTFDGKVYMDGTLMGEMQNGTVIGSRVHFTVDGFDLTGTLDRGRLKVDVIVQNGAVRTLTMTKTAAPDFAPSGSWSRYRCDDRTNLRWVGGSARMHLTHA